MKFSLSAQCMYLPDPGVKPMSPASQADALLSESPGYIYTQCTYRGMISMQLSPLLSCLNNHYIIIKTSEVEYRYMCHKLKYANRTGDSNRRLGSNTFTLASISKKFQKFLWSNKFEKLCIYTP